MPPQDARLNARLKSARDSAVNALAEYQESAPKATLLAEYVAGLFLAGQQEEASAWMALAQLYTALWQARSTDGRTWP
jgi:hypothetical protein